MQRQWDDIAAGVMQNRELYALVRACADLHMHTDALICNGVKSFAAKPRSWASSANPKLATEPIGNAVLFAEMHGPDKIAWALA